MSVVTRRIALMMALCVLGCREERSQPEPLPTFADVQPMLQRACVSCHGPELARAGYSVSDYLSTIGCAEGKGPATLPANASAPLIAVFERPDHRQLLNADELELLSGWVSAGAPAFRGTVHEPSIIDPRSEGWHGRLLAQEGFHPLVAADDSYACGRCHAGMPVQPEGFVTPAPQATACTSCHSGEKGVLDCATCHGNDGRSYPPRDACFFPGPAGDAHGAHVADTQLSEPLSCSGCHPTPDVPVLTPPHADGHLDVDFSAPAAGQHAMFDAATKTCMVECHARGGTLPSPRWDQDPTLDCQSCHRSPPPDHYPGTCNLCHASMGEGSDQLLRPELHVNGKVDLGHGEAGTCAACHGTPPRDSGHTVHAGTQLTVAPGCDACHRVPTAVHSPGHLDGHVDVLLGELASARGRSPEYIASEQRCADVACHGAGLPDSTLEPRWTDPALAGACSGCHGAPPPAPHVQSQSCGGGLCHGAEVGLAGFSLSITEGGQKLHINGEIDVGL